MSNQYSAHGDILYTRIGEAGSDAKPPQTVTLALGEMTGHAHIVKGAVLVKDWHTPSRNMAHQLEAAGVDTSDGNFQILIFDVPEVTTLEHLKHGREQAEHEQQTVVPGRHVAWRQREFDWFEGERAIHD